MEVEWHQKQFLDAHGDAVPYEKGAPVTWRLSAYALAVKDGKVLMVEQGSGRRWELPGGRVELHETLLEAAVRECREETGYRFAPSAAVPLHVAENFFWKRGTASFHHGVVFVYEGVVVGEVEPTWTRDALEIGRIVWMDPRHLTTSSTHPAFWPALEKAGLVGSAR